MSYHTCAEYYIHWGDGGFLVVLGCFFFVCFLVCYFAILLPLVDSEYTITCQATTILSASCMVYSWQPYFTEF